MDVNFLPDKTDEESLRRKLERQNDDMQMTTPSKESIYHKEPPPKIINPQNPPPPPKETWIRRLIGKRVKSKPIEADKPLQPLKHHFSFKFRSIPKESLTPVTPPSPLNKPTVRATPENYIEEIKQSSYQPKSQLSYEHTANKPIVAEKQSVKKIEESIKPTKNRVSFYDWKGHFARFSVVGWIIIVILVVTGSWFARSFMVARAQEELTALKNQSASWQTNLNSNLGAFAQSETEFNFLSSRLSALAEILRGNNTITPVFSLLEKTVLPTVEYTKLSFVRPNLIELSGTAITYDDIAKQMMALSEVEGVAAVRLHAADYNIQNRLINFSFDLTITLPL